MAQPKPNLDAALAHLRKAVGLSANTLRDMLRNALHARFRPNGSDGDPWNLGVEDVFDNVVVYRDADKIMQVGFAVIDGAVQLGADPVQVVYAYVPIKEALTQQPSPATTQKDGFGPARVFQEIRVVIDRPCGFVQRGRDAAGTEWERTYTADYGFIPGTKGGDGEGLDVFLGPSADAKTAYWVVQSKDDGTFDEYKLMLGFPDQAAARKVYLAHVPERFLKGIAETSIGIVKALLGLEPMEVMKRELASLMGDYFDVAMMADALTSPPKPAPAPTQKQAELASSAPMELRLLPTQKAAAAEQRFILGVVLMPETVDAQGDIYDAETVRKSAHDWMRRFRNLDLQHKIFINGLAEPVESYIAPTDLEVNGQAVKAGTWLLGVRVVDDELWRKVKAGELTGFSINGFAQKSPA